MRTDLPDFSNILWIPIEDIFNSWLSIDSSKIKLGPQERTYEEWMNLLNYKRKNRGYETVLPLLTETGFLRPLAFRTYNKNLYLPNGHHRLTAAYDLGYKYIPFVEAVDGQSAYYDIHEFEDSELWSLIHPENPLPTNPKIQKPQ